MKIDKLLSVTFLIFLSSLLFSSLAFAGSSYLCVDDNGTESMTDYPMDGQKCKVTGELKEMTTKHKSADNKERLAKELKRRTEIVADAPKPKQESPYQECVKKVRANNTNIWIDHCKKRGLSAGCALPSGEGAAINGSMASEEQDCFEKYHPLGHKPVSD